MTGNRDEKTVEGFGEEWAAFDQSGLADEEFDRWFLDLLKAGDHDRLLRECTLERMEAAGSGGTAELLAWVLVLAFTRGPAEVLAYMPAVAWRSGTGMVVWPELQS